MLEEQLVKKSKKQPLSIAYDECSFLPLDYQLRQHIKELSLNISWLNNHSYHVHFLRSLKANATDIINQDEFRGFTDYIQYGIASQVSRLTFGRMFETKVRSVLFT